MKLTKRTQDTPGLNTTSTADISFMLLVFFLVTTSMFVDKGLSRQLPPKEKDPKEQKDVIVDKANTVNIAISNTGIVSANDSVIEPQHLSQFLKDFVLNRGKEHLIILDAHPDCAYQAYYKVQNALSIAYKDAREALAQQEYGCGITALTSQDREKIYEKCPQRVAENYYQEDAE